MNIVRITSGLGNQIFQYAFYRALKANIAETRMDISEFRHRNHHNGYELERVFNIIPDYADRRECNQIADMSKSIWSEIRRKFLKIKLNCRGIVIRESDLGTSYHQQLLSKTDSYFVGFWQTEKYFSSVESLLRKELSFKTELSGRCREIADVIRTTNSVSLHVRRGDYQKARRAESFGTVCTLDYYRKAIDLICSKVANPTFFIFSDDMIWVKENLKIDNAYYVDFNTHKESYRDMQLMSLCNHNIIANSSFSWWGAWLNPNPDKIVVAPNIWFRGAEMPDIVPESWTKIEID